MGPANSLRRLFANLSIRSKIVLIILISTLFSLVSGFLVVINSTTRGYRAELEEQTLLIAKVLADYSEVSLQFGSEGLAIDAMRTIFRNVPDVANGCIKSLLIEQTLTEGNTDFDLLSDLTQLEDENFMPLGGGGAGLGLVNEDGEDVEGEFSQDWVCYHPNIDPEIPDDLEEGEVFIRDGFVYALEPVKNSQEADPVENIGLIFLKTDATVVDEEIRKHYLSMLGLLAILVGAAIVFAYYLQRFISQPILDLAERALHISHNADYSIRVQKPGNDEIGLLFDGFNDMLEQIQHRQEELERSNRDLDQFAHVASHDLKAPLRAISTLSGWLEEDLGDQLSEEGREQMKLLRSRVRRMDALIEGILRYARVGRTSVHDEEVDVGQLLVGVVEWVDPPDAFTVSIGEGMPTIVTSRVRLEQIFSNLINNAIKYHDRDTGRIEIRVVKHGEFYQFSVEDDGPGIAPEHHERVFRMFQTLQPRDKVESTGLGLALVKRLVEDEGGTIRLVSESGKGACFLFTWPAERPSTGSLTRSGHTRPG